MVRNQASPLRRTCVNSVSIIVRLSRAQRSPQLPEQVCRKTLGRERGLLPLALDAAVVGCGSICLESQCPIHTYRSIIKEGRTRLGR